MTAIEFDHVSRHFGGVPVLDGLTFAVPPSEAFALLGRNGTGKSTSIRILLNFLEPHAGHSRVLGVDSGALDPATRERIGYVSEGHKLYGDMRLPMLLDFEAATRSRFDRALAASTLAKLGLRTNVAIRKLSKGQQALVALTIAIAGRPEVLVYDDPAMGLDVVHRHELMGSLAEAIEQHGVALLFSSHILTDVERMADRVGILRNGRLVVDASIESLRRRVQRRVMRPKAGADTNGALLRDVPAILRSRKTDGGVALTLVDLDETQERRLRERADVLTDPDPLNLEELFVEFTAEVTP
ncbi:MAG: ABC transporter ATP-binding protein [Planctomycetes bacterium]|nr:ABC transporter ATP-binding protein [Planctomycetota bacterium]